MEKQSKTQEAKLCLCRTGWEWQAEQTMSVLHSFLHSGCWRSNQWLHGSWAAAGCGVKAARSCRSTWKFLVLETDLLGAAPPEKPLGAFKPDETPQTQEILSQLIYLSNSLHSAGKQAISSGFDEPYAKPTWHFCVLYWKQTASCPTGHHCLGWPAFQDTYLQKVISKPLQDDLVSMEMRDYVQHGVHWLVGIGSWQSCWSSSVLQSLAFTLFSPLSNTERCTLGEKEVNRDQTHHPYEFPGSKDHVVRP